MAPKNDPSGTTLESTSRDGSFCLTFDNLGDSAEKQSYLASQPTFNGKHPSVEFAPSLLEIIQGIPATYFLEGINAFENPAIIRALSAAGHEIGIHAWQHEAWGTLNASQRSTNLRECMDALASNGIGPRGFRPPGGPMPEGSIGQIEKLGLSYCSPLGEPGKPHIQDGCAVLPYAWKHVDAYMIDPDLADLRALFGDERAPMSPAQWKDILFKAVEDAGQGANITVIFHPYLLARTPELVDVLRDLIALLRESKTTLLRCQELADRILKN